MLIVAESALEWVLWLRVWFILLGCFLWVVWLGCFLRLRVCGVVAVRGQLPLGVSPNRTPPNVGVTFRSTADVSKPFLSTY